MAQSKQREHGNYTCASYSSRQLQADPATYICRRGGGHLIIGTHVDDLFVLFNREGERLKDAVWKHLTKHLSIKDLGEATWTLR